jgi:hypothetical protein
LRLRGSQKHGLARTDPAGINPANPHRITDVMENANESDKFAGLDELIGDAKKLGVDFVIVHSPLVLGDTYSELVTNLDKIAAADLKLMIVPPSERNKPTFDPRRN